MNDQLEARILAITGARSVRDMEVIQRLWSGYGTLARVILEGASAKSVIVKYVSPKAGGAHPRGWNTNVSHQRKMRSYEIEAEWYKCWNQRVPDSARIPGTVGAESADGELLLVLEDLDAAGFPERRSGGRTADLKAGLTWLAEFHAHFLGVDPEGLWPEGTYWHLATRPDELSALDDPALKSAAPVLDEKLRSAQFQTIVHGDAKIANFCFGMEDGQIAAVDFQYVGGGCGMKDVAYFISSCLDERQCERQEDELLEVYFGAVQRALARCGREEIFIDLEREWRSLYPVAWTDFYRFLKGWSPGHWKIHSYSERLSRDVLGGLA